MKRGLNDLMSRLGIIGELMRFLWARKLWWMIPMIAALLIVGIIVIIGAVAPGAAPFIYSLF